MNGFEISSVLTEKYKFPAKRIELIYANLLSLKNTITENNKEQRQIFNSYRGMSYCERVDENLLHQNKFILVEKTTLIAQWLKGLENVIEPQSFKKMNALYLELANLNFKTNTGLHFFEVNSNVIQVTERFILELPALLNQLFIQNENDLSPLYRGQKSENIAAAGTMVLPPPYSAPATSFSSSSSSSSSSGMGVSSSSLFFQKPDVSYFSSIEEDEPKYPRFHNSPEPQ